MKIAALLLVCAIAACSGDDAGRSDGHEGKTNGAASQVPTAGSGGSSAYPRPVEYGFVHAGATGVVSVPTPPTDPRVAEYDAYRQQAGGIEVTYFVSDIDNTSGTTKVDMYKIVIVTADDRQIEAPNIATRLTTWRDTFASTRKEDNGDAYDRGVSLQEAITPVPPGSTGALINAAAQVIPSVARVFIYPAGALHRVEAVRVT